MRHYFSIFALTALLSLFSTTASAYDIAVENEGVTIYYNFINDGTELVVTYKDTNYNSYAGVVVIPEEVTYNNTKYSVTSIGNSAFSGCSDLTSVTIPNSVTSIGNAAFWYCSGLTSITIPNSVTSIGGDTFHMCTGLTSISIPNSVTSIGGLAFSGCTGLTSVTIPNSVTSIGDGAFEDCTDLKKVIVKDIAAWCNISFGISTSNPLYYAHHLYSDENTEITDLVIPNSVTSIGNNAFSGCKGLTSVTIPNSVTTIGYFAFEGCTSLTSVTIPNGVTSIEGCAFSGCTGLTSVTIPNSVTSIGYDAFEDCTDLKKVIVKDIAAWCNISFAISTSNPLYYAHHLYSDENTEITDLVIPDSVTRICSFTFSGCSGITSVTIPNSVNDFGYYAFEGCTGLKKVIVKDIAAWCNISFSDIDSNPLYHAHHLYSDENTEITDLVIPDNVTIIRRHAFYGCSGLTSVIIPNSVRSIGGYAFYCDNLTTVKSYIETPSAINGKTQASPAFHLNAFNKATLYVPAGTKEKYKATEGWKDFASIEEFTYNPYDLNDDTKISTADIQVIINDMKKPQTLQDLDHDLNGDGKISTADIQVIINEMKK